MEDEHHHVGSWGYRIETWKPALNLFLSLATNTNCLQENLIIFLCLSPLSLNADLYVPSLSFSIQLLRWKLYIKLSKWLYQQLKYSSKGHFSTRRTQVAPRKYWCLKLRWSKAAVGQALLRPEDNRPLRATRIFLLNLHQYMPKYIQHDNYYQDLVDRRKTGTEFLSHHPVSSSSALSSKQPENGDGFSAWISLMADKPYICSHTCIQTGN